MFNSSLVSRIAIASALLLASFSTHARAQVVVDVEMPDGVLLKTDVWEPAGASTPRPVVLRRTPYGRALDAALRMNLNNLGYTVVSQDVRGRGGSQGEFLPFFPDAVDGPATMRWIELQPWSNGKIGTWGGSAEGMTQMMALPDAPDSLLCSHISVATDRIYDSLLPGGVWRDELTTDWLNGQGAGAALTAWRAHEARDSYWDPVMLDDDERSRIRARVFQVGGFFDIFAAETIGSHARFVAHSESSSGQFLVMGAFTHAFSAANPIGEINYPTTAQYDWATDFVAFFDHCLKDGPAPTWQPLRYYVTAIADDGVTSAGEWRELNAWPPASTATPWQLSPASAMTALAVDPAAPIASIGGGNLSTPAGPRDQSSIDMRADVLSITTPPAEEEFELIGNPTARIYASSATTDVDVIVRLTQVTPTGKSILITDGARRGKFVADRAAITPLTPGEPVAFDVDLGPVAITVPVGHSIRVAISGTSYPRYEANPNTAVALSTSPTPVPTTLTIYTDDAHPSTFTFPVTLGRVPGVPIPVPEPDAGVNDGGIADGGTAGSSGMAGSSVSGTGGTINTGGTGGSADVDAGSDDNSDSSGCGCRVGAQPRNTSAAWLLCTLALVLGARTRRRL